MVHASAQEDNPRALARGLSPVAYRHTNYTIVFLLHQHTCTHFVLSEIFGVIFWNTNKWCNMDKWLLNAIIVPFTDVSKLFRSLNLTSY